MRKKTRHCKTNTDHLYFKEISVHLSTITDYYILSSIADLAHRLQWPIFFVVQRFYKILSKVSTKNIFTFYQPQLVIKLFLIFQTPFIVRSRDFIWKFRNAPYRIIGLVNEKTLVRSYLWGKGVLLEKNEL